MIARRLRLSRQAFPRAQAGKRAVSPHFSLSWGPAVKGGVSAVVSKKIARRSVDRHLLKRRMLSVMRPFAAQDRFLIAYARTGSLTLPFRQLAEELSLLLASTERHPRAE